MRMMKRALALLLSLALNLALLPAAFAANDEARCAAETLYSLGLFLGTGTDDAGEPVFELDRTPVRTEAVTMLVRLLGREAEAEAGVWENDFADVPDWAKPTVGFAYAHGLTLGTNEEGTAFGSDLASDARQYLTFVLRALGYSSDEQTGDFAWNAPWLLTDALGLTSGEYREENSAAFTRGDAAAVSLRALSAVCADNSGTLAERLIAEGAFTQEQYLAALASGNAADGDYSAGTVYSRMIAMQEVYPEGMRWTNDNEYVLRYVNPETGADTSFYGYGCVGFAFAVSSAAFGDLPLRTMEKGSFAYEDLRVGDMPRINNDAHTVIILEKHDDHVVIAEGNYNSAIHWGRTLSREQIMTADYVWTRYP